MHAEPRPLHLIGQLAASCRRDLGLLTAELYPHKAILSRNRNDLPQFGVEIVLEQRRAWHLEIAVRVLLDIATGDEVKLLATGDFLDDARSVTQAEIAQGVRPMAAVIQNESAVDLKCV